MKTFIMNPGIGVVAVEDVVDFWEAQAYEHDQTYHPILCQDQNGNPKKYHVFGFDLGKKYIRVWNDRSGQKYVFCFIDRMTGLIYKSASWKAPAKHPRGSIFDENYSWGKGVTVYGGAYMR